MSYENAYNPYLNANGNPYMNVNYGAMSMPYTVPQSRVAAPVPQSPPTPPPPAITGETASKAMRRFILGELREAGFDSAEHEGVLEVLEGNVVTLIERLYRRAHEYANLSNRAGAIASDLLVACHDEHVPLHPPKRHRTHVDIELAPPPPRSPSPKLLPSRSPSPSSIHAPTHIPLPPKHTYTRTTPLTPPTSIPSLDKKLRTAGLVQESLRSLMMGTEGRQEDEELLGHVVNWQAQAGTRGRKRWRV